VRWVAPTIDAMAGFLVHTQQGSAADCLRERDFLWPLDSKRLKPGWMAAIAEDTSDERLEAEFE
jgi:hypothetical protein